RLLELLVRVVARVPALRLRRDDLVEQLAVAVLLPRLGVRLPDRESLAERPSALCADHDQAGAGRPFQDLLPLVLGEVGLARHGCLLSIALHGSDPARA